MRKTIAAVALLAAGCGGSPEPVPAPDATAELARLAEIEDARDEDAKELASAATSRLPEVRARAALVMGRMLRAKHVDKLLTLAADSNAIVRRTAIWSLGQYGWTPCGRETEVLAKIRPMLEDREESVRAAAVEAVGKLGEAQAPAIVAPFLRDPSPRVRAEAAMACVRWRRVLRSRDPKVALPQIPDAALEGLIALAGDPDPELRWRAAFALVDKRAVAVLQTLVADSGAWARLYAIRSLRGLKAADAADTVAGAQSDAEYTVRAEAVQALVDFKRPELVRADLAKDPSYHVRAAVALTGRDDVADALAVDPSVVVRAALVKGRTPALQEKAKSYLAAAIVNREWLVREAAVEAATSLKEAGLSILEIAQDDRNEIVRAAVASGAGEIEGRRAFALLRRALASTGVAERGAAIEALGGRAEPEAGTLARDAYAACVGRGWIEVRESAVDVVDKLPGDPTPWLREVLASDPAASVQRKAYKALKRRGIADLREPPDSITPTPHRERFASNPVVLLQTTRGTMAIECFPKDAPVHVANFVGLVRQGFYDGLTWHRVVPNFVIQGGDPTGTGAGDAGWSMRAEISGQHYARGTLGMPRSADWDTGGCQIFITHVPTPQLDTHYTIFGRVSEGLDVIDAIERGDRIVKATVRE